MYILMYDVKSRICVYSLESRILFHKYGVSFKVSKAAFICCNSFRSYLLSTGSPKCPEFFLHQQHLSSVHNPYDNISFY